MNTLPLAQAAAPRGPSETSAVPSLTVPDVAARCGFSESTASRYVRGWFGPWKQHREALAAGAPSVPPKCPETTQEHGGGRGRPGYRVDAAGLARWLRRSAPQNDNAIAGRRAA